MRRCVYTRVPPADAREQTVGCKCDVWIFGPRLNMEDFLLGTWADVVRGHEGFHFPVNELIEFLRGSQNTGLY